MEKQPLRCMILHPIYVQDLTELEYSVKKIEKIVKANNLTFGLMRVGMLMYLIIDTPIDDVNIMLKKEFNKDYILIDATEGMLEGDIKYQITDSQLNQLSKFFESIQKAGNTLKKESGSFSQTINQIKNERDSKPYYETLTIPKAIDIILDKIGQNGFDSLNEDERSFLSKHSK